MILETSNPVAWRRIVETLRSALKKDDHPEFLCRGEWQMTQDGQVIGCVFDYLTAGRVSKVGAGGTVTVPVDKFCTVKALFDGRTKYIEHVFGIPAAEVDEAIHRYDMICEYEQVDPVLAFASAAELFIDGLKELGYYKEEVI
jgi:hypothetical protein